VQDWLNTLRISEHTLLLFLKKASASSTNNKTLKNTKTFIRSGNNSVNHVCMYVHPYLPQYILFSIMTENKENPGFEPGK
jgi:hypothetical protein